MIDFVVIGKRIKKYRRLSGLTQEALAEKLNISTEHMSRIESGKYKMSYALAEQICKEFNMDEAALYFGLSSSQSNNSIDQKYSKLTETQKRIIDDLLEELLNRE